MSGKEDGSADGKYDSSSGKYDDEEITDVGERVPPPKIEIISINFDPAIGPLSGPLELKMKFELDRDVVAGYWIIRFLVDSCDRRLIKVCYYVISSNNTDTKFMSNCNYNFNHTLHRNCSQSLCVFIYLHNTSSSLHPTAYLTPTPTTVLSRPRPNTFSSSLPPHYTHYRY